MSYIMVDIESNGPIPGDYSMYQLGAVIIDKKLDKTFYSQLKPLNDNFKSSALEITGLSHGQKMLRFEEWINNNSKGKPIFISDNNGFDWMFICWYFIHFLDRNPFGYSSQNLGSFYKGIMKDVFVNFKHLRKTNHSHNPVDDAIGNAEALLTLKDMYKLKIPLE